MSTDYGYQGDITLGGKDPTTGLLVIPKSAPLVKHAESDTGTDLNSYEAFFNAFQIPGDSSGTWSSFYNNFVASYTAKTGQTFNLSTAYDSWTQVVVARYFQSFTGGSAPLQTTVSSPLVNGKHPTAIINNIFSLLVAMIESLQNVTAAQAGRLQIEASWQSAYTDLQSQVKYAFKTGGDPTIADDNTRTDFNNFNTNLIQNIQARKSLVSDDSKNLQTNVSQSNNAVDQQTSMATSLIQQLATMLQSIYR